MNNYQDFAQRIINGDIALHWLLFIDDETELNGNERSIIDQLFNNKYRRQRIINERINWFQVYDGINFKKRFHLTKEHFMTLFEKVEPKLTHSTDRNNAIPPIIQLLATLRFYATGSFLLAVADFCGISEVSAHSFIHKASETIASLHMEYIKMPSNDSEMFRNQNENFQISGFVRVIGVIDCFHVRVKSFGRENSEYFRNRKGYFSINVQAIVNSRMEIIDLVARWFGSTHDSTMFDNSRIKARFENEEFGSGLLLGDSGYPTLPYLLTPLQNPQSSAEVLYNEALIRTRCLVERCFGVLQKVFQYWP
ncbi:putative nuclease HARBI1 [Prorops nasuta]|uniref:putative nuclease HARBI1 n=1 Tax=Prorops nasuta TaxID=863751 RepID=UPI0034CD7FAC